MSEHRMVETPRNVEEPDLSQINPKPFTKILATSMLSQGAATRPRALVAAMNPKTGEAIVAEWGFPQRPGVGGAYWNSDYFTHDGRRENVAQAMDRFVERLGKDVRWYVITNNQPLTSEPQEEDG